MKVFVALLFSIVITACSSTSKENHYYSLNLNHVVKQSKNQHKKIVLIRPIQLSPMLSGQGLVMQLGNHQIVTANHNLWAEPLDQAIAKLLQQRLNNNCIEYNFEVATHYLKYHPTFSIQIEIDQFNGTDQSTVEVSGRYWIIEKKENIGPSKRFLITNDLNQDGYLHMVEKLNQAVTSLANEICDGLVELNN